MHLIPLADLHLTCSTPIARLDNIEETWKRKLKFILDYANKNKIPILVGGDFFDRPRDWKTLSEFIKFIADYPDVSIHSIWGQHDMYLYSADRYSTSLGVLIKSGLVEELKEHYLTKERDIAIYGCSWGQEVPTPQEEVINILVIHKNISAAPLFPGHEFTNADQFLKSHQEYQVIVCGDIHRRFVFADKGRVLVNPGPLLRMEATEYNMEYEPKFAILDTETQIVDWIDIPHEPAEKVLSRKHIENKKETENMLDDFIKNISVDHKITFSFKENLQEYLTKNKITQDVKNIISKVMEE
jgi:DNA repair exonuclease SbcCD nuclease subunit